MLLNLHKKSWIDGLTLRDYSDHCHTNDSTVKDLLQLAKNYNKVSCVFLLRLLTGYVVKASNNKFLSFSNLDSFVHRRVTEVIHSIVDIGTNRLCGGNLYIGHVVIFLSRT